MAGAVHRIDGPEGNRVSATAEQAAAEVLPQFATVTVDVEVLRGDGRLPPWSADLDFATASSRASSRDDARNSHCTVLVRAMRIACVIRLVKCIFFSSLTFQ